MSLQSEYYESLTHHGVKGQKWGVRRYQNSDGTLTNEGKRRYDDKSKKKRKPMSDALHTETKALSISGFATAGVGHLMTVAGTAIEVTNGRSFVTQVMRGAGVGMTVSGLITGFANAGKLHADNKLRAKSGRD